MTDLPTQYDHQAAQQRWYAFWESKGYFHSEPDTRPASDPARKKPFTIVIPPPNVTGALHLGHALNNTLQDILVRMKRMQGYNTLWMPGTDHAGIATQAVVERRLLEEEKLSRHDLGRDKLVERIWQWKEAYEQRIIGQLKQLGSSCDWQRLRFTLDDQCARAVRETFFRLFKDGKIYRGKRLVNWDTFLQTAVSDDEVFHETVKGNFWHFKYPVVDPKEGEPQFVTIATTRPETMLGDTAVAVHPDPAAALAKAQAELEEKLAVAPEKEKQPLASSLEALKERRLTLLPQLEQLRDMALDGRMLELPLTGRTIPLIADEWAKPELGSGCVKITPAHDANDYEVWQRHPEIGAINIMNPDGTLNDSVPEKYRGLVMHKQARTAVVADMEAADLYNPETDREDREIDLAHSDRSKTPIEPYLADQWFVAMGDTLPLPPGESRGEGNLPLPPGEGLAQSAMDAVTDGRVKIVPERYAKGYLDWLSEKRDWPIGRQLWWGHRIPIWSYDTEVKATAEQLEKFNRAGISSVELPGQKVLGEAKEHIACQWHVNPETGNVSALVCVGPEQEDKEKYLKQNGFVQDTDVLDTWFSSALWPHSTLGWPGPPHDKSAPDWEKMRYYYPTSVLITSRDIITLWVARMVLTGLYNVGDIPFHQVFIHPKILDGYGETMSKSKGNGVDPLDVIEKFGADSLRFALAYMTTETQDVRMPVEFECPHCQTLINQTKKNRVLPRVECPKCGKPFRTQWAERAEDQALPRGAVVSERFELGRNFCNKLWNVSRLALLNLTDYSPASVADDELAVEDRWILSRLAAVTSAATDLLERFRYAEAATTLYKFAWDEFCSFYAEMAKRRWDDPPSRTVAQRVFAHTLDVLLRLLHPMIPFLTEEVWQRLGEAAPERGLEKPQAAAESIMIAAWPEPDDARRDPAIEQRFARFQEVLGTVREIRSRQNIPPRETIHFAVRCGEATAELLRPMEPYFASMARAEVTGWGESVEPPALCAQVSLADAEVYVDLREFIDVGAEVARNEKLDADISGRIAAKKKKLQNENFVSRAPSEVVAKERESLAQLEQQLATVRETLAGLQEQQ